MFLSWRFRCSFVGSNDVQDQKGKDRKLHMQPNVKYTVVKDSRKLGSGCSCDKQQSANQLRNCGTSFENMTRKLINSTAIYWCLLCEQWSVRVSQEVIKKLQLEQNTNVNELMKYQTIRVITIVVVGWGCHNKIPHSGWPTQKKEIVSQFWILEVQDQGVSRVGSF